MVVLLTFAFTVYATNNVLGSPGKVYDLLVQAGKAHPVDGNAQGSYLTMRSREGAIFFVINIVGNFGTVFCDNGYYNKAIAAHPVHALPGYVAGGLSVGVPLPSQFDLLSDSFDSGLPFRSLRQQQWVSQRLRWKAIQFSQPTRIAWIQLMSQRVWSFQLRRLQCLALVEQQQPSSSFSWQ